MLGHQQSSIHVNYRYILDFIKRENTNTPHARILDYGCGNGDIVENGLAEGVDIHGADVFYSGSDSYEVVKQKGLLGNRILTITDNHVDFPDSFFDLIVCNQVFEHVQDMDAALAEIDRILKPGGRFLCLFPSRDVWREGHCGVPFLHWFPKDSQSRLLYIRMMRRLGVGKFKNNLPNEEWIKFVLNWLDKYCFYRSRRTIKRSFRKYFEIRFIESEYASFRLKASRLAAFEPLTRFPLTKPLVNEAFRKLGGLVMLCTKIQP
jgi:SAM-dependent methyltransferase